MKIKATIEISQEELQTSGLGLPRKLDLESVVMKYKFDPMKEPFLRLYDYLVNELKVDSEDIIIYQAFNNWEELKYFDCRVRESKHQIDKIYIPNQKRIEERLIAAKNNIHVNSRWTYYSETELDVNYLNFQKLLNEIKEGAAKLGIAIIEV